MKFTQAIVRTPGSNFALGLSSTPGGAHPDIKLAAAQHARYCAALRTCGVELTELAADLCHPDSTFVEDTAVLTHGAAILARPGAPSRLAEAAAMLEPLRRFFGAVHEIRAPGTLDGGDVCEADGEFFIGLSARTNEHGAQQLVSVLAALGVKATLIDIRASKSLLHLKSGLSYVGDGVCIVAPDADLGDTLRSYELITVSPEEAYAANCVRVNDHILLAAGYPHLLATLAARGMKVLQLEMSEFQKMDGGLSCLSLRF